MNAELFTLEGAAQAAPIEPADVIFSKNGARYGWRIDTDHSQHGKGDAGTNGPRNISPFNWNALTQGQGVPFRMYDDDGVLIYSGRFIGDIDSLHAFGPLDDFGMPNFGCTRIDYKRGRAWETL